MTATILTVGEELIIGQVADTNAVWLSKRLTRAGVKVRKVITVGDQEGEISQILTEEWPRGDLLIMTGGLGATPDDLTREVMARHFSRELVSSTEVRPAA